MLIDNRDVTVDEKLRELIKQADEIYVCSPFITYSNLLFDILNNKKVKLKLICRLSYPATPSFFREVLAKLNANKSIVVYDDNSLHSKIYLFRKNKKSFAAIIGSSNFTNSGISTNKEMNVVVRKELTYLEKYFTYLIENSYGNLSERVIQYYESFYQAPNSRILFRGTRINRRLVNAYNEIINRYALVHGVLSHLNNTTLPFTYLFDSFAHFFITEIRRDYNISESDILNRNELIRYFNIFLRDYFSHEDLLDRNNSLRASINIRINYSTTSEATIKRFFQNLHSVSYGSGHIVRQSNIENISVRLLRELLSFIISEQLDMAQKYAVALTPRSRRGLKLNQLGPSTIGEIPGWIFPDEFPIINQKFLRTLDHFTL